jgi:hypothetical protein
MDGNQLLGSGNQLSIKGLRAGGHELILEATDGFGRVGRSSVKVTVIGVVPQLVESRAALTVTASDQTLAIDAAATVPATLSLGSDVCDIGFKEKHCEFAVPAGADPTKLTLVLAGDGGSAQATLVQSKEQSPAVEPAPNSKTIPFTVKTGGAD